MIAVAPGAASRITPATIELDELPVPVRLKPNTRARRFTLRLDQTGESAVLTLPPGISGSEIRMFLIRNAAWLEGALNRKPRPVIVAPGTVLPLGGEPLLIVQTSGPRRAPRVETGRLLVQGTGHVGRRVRAFLRDRARSSLVPAAHHYAGLLGRQVRSVAIRDTRSRWGSCTTLGTLSFSWRLAMAPGPVIDYVAAHEAAHLIEMNHGPRFWALLGSLVPEFETHRSWLKNEGRELHAYRFEYVGSDPTPTGR